MSDTKKLDPDKRVRAAHQFTKDILKALGLDGLKVTKLNITIEPGRLPVITASLLPQAHPEDVDLFNLPEYLADMGIKPFIEQ